MSIGYVTAANSQELKERVYTLLDAISGRMGGTILQAFKDGTELHTARWAMENFPVVDFSVEFLHKVDSMYNNLIDWWARHPDNQ